MKTIKARRIESTDAVKSSELEGAQHNVIRAVKELADLLEEEGQGGAISTAIIEALKKSVPSKHYKFLKSGL